MNGLTCDKSHRNSRELCMSSDRCANIDAARAVAYDATNDLRLSRIVKPAHTRKWRRMWDYQQLIALKLTPPTRTPATQLDEVDRAFVLVIPAARHDLVLARVDLQQRAGPDHRIHREIGQTKMTVKDVTRTVVAVS